MVGMRQAQYTTLKQKAHEILLDKSVPVNSPDNLLLVFQLLIEPSFYNHISWTIFAEKTGSTRIVRQTIWDKEFDSGRFHDPLKGLKHGWDTWPMVATKIAALDQVWFDSLREEGHEYAITEPQSGIGLDSVQWSVYMPGCFEDRTISWNFALSNKELVKWAKRCGNS